MERIILDVDTGHDDAVAIDLAAGSPEIKIEALIACAGNHSLENTLNNTLNMAEMLGLDAPVFKGAKGPLLREQVKAGNIHGENGFEGPVFAPRVKKQAEEGNTTEFIIDTVMSNPGEISFVSVGPYTDLALALRAEPRLAKNFKKIVVMGGSSGKGNITPQAEFNVFADPDAAQIVFNCGADVYVMPLDATLQVVLRPEVLEDIMKIKSQAVEVFGKSMACYTQRCLEYIHDYPAMHDPCCIAYLLDPGMFEFTTQMVNVETVGRYAYGRTCLSWPDPEAKVHWARKVDAKRFWELLKRSFNNLKGVC